MGSLQPAARLSLRRAVQPSAVSDGLAAVSSSPFLEEGHSTQGSAVSDWLAAASSSPILEEGRSTQGSAVSDWLAAASSSPFLEEGHSTQGSATRCFIPIPGLHASELAQPRNGNKKSPACGAFLGLRSEPDSNRCKRFCRPVPSHSAIRP
jgi:hypothetical protein